jgi:hypothetical protein
LLRPIPAIPFGSDVPSHSGTTTVAPCPMCPVLGVNPQNGYGGEGVC